MEKIKAFSNAQEFQALFGITERGTRKNGILLSFLKAKSIWDYCRENNRWDLLGIRSLQDLKQTCLSIVESESYRKYCRGDREFQRTCHLNNKWWYNDKYYTDNEKGICLDDVEGDGKFIRYINAEHGHGDFKMKAGKFYQYLILMTEFGKALPQQALVWLLEELCAEWRTYVASAVPKYELNVDDNFEKIYSRYSCAEEFGSCMQGADQHYFYQDSVKAKAAYLENEFGKVVARCVIFTDVRDENDKVWRLAERQYARNGNDTLKRLLVNNLIKGGYIDGYKQVGVGCGDSTMFVDNEGNDLQDKDFRIRCNLHHGDTLSYQDSFKCYMPEEGWAYNHWQDDAEDDDRLDTTDSEFYGSLRRWDSYNEEWCRDVYTVYVQGEEFTCNADNMDDFVYFKGDYVHVDDIMQCENCGDDFLDPSHYDWYERCHSDLTGEDYCCQECLEEAEEKFKEENWHWSHFESEYFELKSQLTEYLHLDGNRYIIQNVCESQVQKYLRFGLLFLHNGVLVDDMSKMLQDDRACEALEELYV